MRDAFIERHRSEWPILIQCAVLRVSRSGLYSWRKRPPSTSVTRRAALTQEVREVHASVARRMERCECIACCCSEGLRAIARRWPR